MGTIAGEHAVFLKMPGVRGVAHHEVPQAPRTTDGHKHTDIRDPLPEFYLQNTCTCAVQSALVRGSIARRLPYAPQAMLRDSQRVLKQDRRLPNGGASGLRQARGAGGVQQGRTDTHVTVVGTAARGARREPWPARAAWRCAANPSGGIRRILAATIPSYRVFWDAYEPSREDRCEHSIPMGAWHKAAHGGLCGDAPPRRHASRTVCRAAHDVRAGAQAEDRD
jgi:hypothetical protein